VVCVKKALVTGATGFIGSNLCKLLLQGGYEVSGTTLEKHDKMQGVKVFECDVKNKEQVSKIVKLVQPDAVFHLAAQPYVRKSWQDPKGTLETNVLGTLNVFESVMQQELDAVIVSATSSIMYQTAKPPFKETDALVPSNPYGLSKVAADHLGTMFAQQYGLKVVNARIFPTTGPGKIGDAPNDFATKLAEISLGQREPKLEVEGLSQKRDLIHVSDNVKALKLLAEKGKKGESYNICRGEAISVEEIVKQMIGFTGKEVELVYDQARIAERGKDVSVVLGDPAKIKSLGWKSAYSYQNLFKEIFDYWVEKKR